MLGMRGKVCSRAASRNNNSFKYFNYQTMVTRYVSFKFYMTSLCALKLAIQGEIIMIISYYMNSSWQVTILYHVR